MVACVGEPLDAANAAPSTLTYGVGGTLFSSKCGATVVQVNCFVDFNGAVKGSAGTVGDRMIGK